MSIENNGRNEAYPFYFPTPYSPTPEVFNDTYSRLDQKNGTSPKGKYS